MKLRYWLSSVALFTVCAVFRLPYRLKEALELLDWCERSYRQSVANDAPVRAEINGMEAQIWLCARGAEHNPIARAAYWQRRALNAEAELLTLRAATEGDVTP